MLNLVEVAMEIEKEKNLNNDDVRISKNIIQLSWNFFDDFFVFVSFYTNIEASNE